jgi:hypothetical protein
VTGDEADRVRRALLCQWQLIEAHLPSLDLESPSRVEGWRNREVVAHLTMQPLLLARFLATASTQPPAVSLTSNLAGTRSLAAMIDAATRQAADGDLAFGNRVREVVGKLTDADLSATVTTVQGAISLADYLVTRCVEAVVHGGDLVAPVTPDEAALAITSDALARVLAEKAPDMLALTTELDPLTWVGAATGRQPPPAGLADVLPLMT